MLSKTNNIKEIKIVSVIGSAPSCVLVFSFYIYKILAHFYIMKWQR